MKVRGSLANMISYRLVGVCIAGALAASACSGGSDSSSPTLILTTSTTGAPTTSITEAPTTTAPPTTTATTLSPEEEAEAELRELAMAYLTYEEDERVTGRVEPWPRLDLLTGRLYDRVSLVREQDLENGHYVVGTYENPVLVSVDLDLEDATARIDLCTDDNSRLVDASGVEIIGRRTGGPVFGYLLAVKVETIWLLDELILGSESCDPSDYL